MHSEGGGIKSFNFFSDEELQHPAKLTDFPKHTANEVGH